MKRKTTQRTWVAAGLLAAVRMFGPGLDGSQALAQWRLVPLTAGYTGPLSGPVLYREPDPAAASVVRDTLLAGVQTRLTNQLFANPRSLAPITAQLEAMGYTPERLARLKTVPVADLDRAVALARRGVEAEAHKLIGHVLFQLALPLGRARDQSGVPESMSSRAVLSRLNVIASSWGAYLEDDSLMEKVKEARVSARQLVHLEESGLSPEKIEERIRRVAELMELPGAGETELIEERLQRVVELLGPPSERTRSVGEAAAPQAVAPAGGGGKLVVVLSKSGAAGGTIKRESRGRPRVEVLPEALTTGAVAPETIMEAVTQVLGTPVDTDAVLAARDASPRESQGNVRDTLATLHVKPEQRGTSALHVWRKKAKARSTAAGATAGRSWVGIVARQSRSYPERFYIEPRTVSPWEASRRVAIGQPRGSLLAAAGGGYEAAHGPKTPPRPKALSSVSKRGSAERLSNDSMYYGLMMTLMMGLFSLALQAGTIAPAFGMANAMLGFGITAFALASYLRKLNASVFFMLIGWTLLGITFAAALAILPPLMS